jgi:hypothetical protein
MMLNLYTNILNLKKLDRRSYFILFLFSALVNLSLLILERLMGFEFSLHDDTRHYIEIAQYIIAEDDWLARLRPNHGFRFLVASSQYLFNSMMPIMGLIFLLGTLVPLSAVRLMKAVFPKSMPGNLMFVGAAIACMPYLSHLSLYLLKDVIFIWLSFEFFTAVWKKNILLSIVLGILMVWLRTYLGFFNCILGTLLIFSQLVVIRTQIILYVTGLVLLYVTGLMDMMLHMLIIKGDRIYIGRAFFPDLLTLNIDNYRDVFFSMFISPIKNIVLPNIFLVENKFELLYSINTSLMQIISIVFLYGIFSSRINFKKEDIYLLLVIFTGFWFIDIAHPNYGAAVRYRETYFLIFVSYMVLKISNITSQGKHRMFFSTVGRNN